LGMLRDAAAEVILKKKRKKGEGNLARARGKGAKRPLMPS